MFLKHFASKNQLPGLFVNGTLVENGLIVNVNYLLVTILCFFVVNDINTSVSDLSENLEKIGNWAFKWKISFNTDPNKQDQEIIFSRKKIASLYTLILNRLNQHKYTNILG